MLEDASTLPQDPAELRQAAVNLVALVKSQALQIEKLKHELAGHRRHRFGATSETLDQLNLRLEEEEIATAEAGKPAPTDGTEGASEPRAKPKRRPLPADLPRHAQVLSPGASAAAH
jgi:transposase